MSRLVKKFTLTLYLFIALTLLLMAGVGSGLADSIPDEKLNLINFDFAQSGDFSTSTIYLPLINQQPLQLKTPQFGVNFISSAEDPADAQQYQNGLATGATWNRWPIYWFNVEQSPGSFNWSAQDTAIIGDIAHGLKTNAILLGTPSFYTTLVEPKSMVERPPKWGNFGMLSPQAAAPVGLYDPIFSDGTDIPGPGKSINPSNVWALFVSKVVNRYRPGGVLAQQQNWPAGKGISYWEMWNEPDLPWFWDSSLADYARLLKVGYLVVRHTDPGAQVLFAGLANNFNLLDYYHDVLAIYAGDPLAPAYNHFHDILATHSYSNSWQSWYHVYRLSVVMTSFGFDKPIWLNESGVPAWNDYPGPVWDPNSDWRATMGEQADYVIQSAFYATFAGADAIFHFQLYDACGNQPYGTDFPPHNGELCGDPNYPICAGDANGLFRNPPDAACFTHHPNPETPRPNFSAFRVLSGYFQGVQPIWRLRPGGTDPYNGPQEWIAFYQPGTRSRVLGLWSRDGSSHTAHVEATGTSALLISPNGSTQVILPVGGEYTLNLPAATNQNYPGDPVPGYYAIGGRPYILVETDVIQPTSEIDAEVQIDHAQVEWAGDDSLGSGVAGYDLFVRVDGGPQTIWLLNTQLTSSTYALEPGHDYTFVVRARDRAGNLSAPANVTVSSPDEIFSTFVPASQGT